MISYGPAWKKKVGALHVVKLKGSFYEMGRQHGQLLAEEVRSGPIPYYRDFIAKLFGAKRFGIAGPAVLGVLNRAVGARVARGLPTFAKETIRGLADGAGLPYADYLEGATMPDSVLWAASRLMQLQGPGPAVYHRLALGLGCTSAVAWGDATADGRLLHARNLDYQGVECWPRTQAVIFHEPDEGMRYVAVAAAGVGLGGITAMNEAGLTLTVHQHMFTDRAKLGGTPIGVVGDLVMRQARTLAEAAKILASHTPIACWTYVVASAHERGVLCHEESPTRNVAQTFGAGRGSNGSNGSSTFGYANIYLDRELGDTEVDLYGSYWRHNHARHVRVNALLAQGAGALDAERMGGILADVGEGPCRVSQSIAMALTVASVVFRPEDGAFWVAAGEAPASHGTFVPFSLAAEDHAPDLGSFTPAVPERAREAFEQYRRAYVAYTDHRDLPVAREAMGRACALEPRQAIYQATTGLLALIDGDAVTASDRLGEAIAVGHADEARVAAFHLWRARARDVRGDRTAAERDYRQVLALRSDAPVAAAARKNLRTPFTRRAASRVHVDMALGDVVAP